MTGPMRCCLMRSKAKRDPMIRSALPEHHKQLAYAAVVACIHLAQHTLTNRCLVCQRERCGASLGKHVYYTRKAAHLSAASAGRIDPIMIYVCISLLAGPGGHLG